MPFEYLGTCIKTKMNFSYKAHLKYLHVRIKQQACHESCFILPVNEQAIQKKLNEGYEWKYVETEFSINEQKSE